MDFLVLPFLDFANNLKYKKYKIRAVLAMLSFMQHLSTA